MENLNPLLSFGQLIMVLLTFLIILGIIQKVGSVAFAIFSYPVYVGLYALESFMPKIKKNQDSIFTLNLPEKYPWKLAMNILASFVFLSLIPVFDSLWKILKNSITSETAQVKAAELIFFENQNIFPTFLVIICMIGLVGIYLISNLISEKDENSPWSKIENLSVPSLWKVFTKENS